MELVNLKDLRFSRPDSFSIMYQMFRSSFQILRKKKPKNGVVVDVAKRLQIFISGILKTKREYSIYFRTRSKPKYNFLMISIRMFYLLIIVAGCGSRESTNTCVGEPKGHHLLEKYVKISSVTLLRSCFQVTN